MRFCRRTRTGRSDSSGAPGYTGDYRLPAPSLQKLVSRELNVPISKVSGVVTFYFMFTMTPKGKHKIRICTGTACHVKGAEQNYRRVKGYLGMQGDETMTKDKFFSVESVRCVGACSLAPVQISMERSRAPHAG